VLVGRQGDAQIAPEELADPIGVSAPGISAGLSPRVARVYVRSGQVVAVTSLVRDS
jgi:hypothetical protein